MSSAKSTPRIAIVDDKPGKPARRLQDLKYKPIESTNGIECKEAVDDWKALLSRPSFTLHGLFEGEAVFLECPETVDVYSATTASFFYDAQLRHATRVLFVPMEQFYAWAEALEVRGDVRQLRAHEPAVQLAQRAPLGRVEPEEQQQHRPARERGEARKGRRRGQRLQQHRRDEIGRAHV